MARKYILYKRKSAIIFTDIIIFAVSLSILGICYFNYHWSIGLITLIALYVLTFYLFFLNKIFRYVFSLLSSLVYGSLFAILDYLIDKENPTTPALVFGILTFLISLFLHKDHFDFIKGSKFIEYDKY